jgi:hypothetical protein
MGAGSAFVADTLQNAAGNDMPRTRARQHFAIWLNEQSE